MRSRSRRWAASAHATGRPRVPRVLLPPSCGPGGQRSLRPWVRLQLRDRYRPVCRRVSKTLLPRRPPLARINGQPHDRRVRTVRGLWRPRRTWGLLRPGGRSPRTRSGSGSGTSSTARSLLRGRHTSSTVSGTGSPPRGLARKQDLDSDLYWQTITRIPDINSTMPGIINISEASAIGIHAMMLIAAGPAGPARCGLPRSPGLGRTSEGPSAWSTPAWQPDPRAQGRTPGLGAPLHQARGGVPGHRGRAPWARARGTEATLHGDLRSETWHSVSAAVAGRDEDQASDLVLDPGRNRPVAQNRDGHLKEKANIYTNMFCYQCEQTAGGKANKAGSAEKDRDAALGRALRVTTGILRSTRTAPVGSGPRTPASTGSWWRRSSPPSPT